ncbi:MAG: hypothetical protein ACLFT3_08845 [Cyclobacteriaceae bacterium]
MMINKNAFIHGALLDRLSVNNLLNVQESGNPSVRLINGALFWIRHSNTSRERDGAHFFTFNRQEEDLLRIRQWLGEYEQVYLALICQTSQCRQIALLDREQLRQWADMLELQPDHLHVWAGKGKYLKVGSLYEELTFEVPSNRVSELLLPLPQSDLYPRQAALKPEIARDNRVISLQDLQDKEGAEGTEEGMAHSISLLQLEVENKALRKELLSARRKLSSIVQMVELIASEGPEL